MPNLTHLPAKCRNVDGTPGISGVLAPSGREGGYPGSRTCDCRVSPQCISCASWLPMTWCVARQFGDALFCCPRRKTRINQVQWGPCNLWYTRTKQGLYENIELAHPHGPLQSACALTSMDTEQRHQILLCMQQETCVARGNRYCSNIYVQLVAIGLTNGSERISSLPEACMRLVPDWIPQPGARDPQQHTCTMNAVCTDIRRARKELSRARPARQ